MELMPKVVVGFTLIEFLVARHPKSGFAGRRKAILPGFTLIELLVVISIIGILAAFAIVSFSSFQAKARDSKRINNLKTIEYALEMYKNDNNGSYPASVPGGQGCWGGWEAGSTINGANDQFLQILIDRGYSKTNPIETNPLLDTSFGTLGWSVCSYRYLRTTEPCSGTGKYYAVIYTWLETKSGESDIKPPTFSPCWGEAEPGTDIDKRDWGIFLEE